MELLRRLQDVVTAETSVNLQTRQAEDQVPMLLNNCGVVN